MLIAVNAGHAWRRRERDLVNGLASVAQSGLVPLAVALVAGVPLRRTVPAFVVVVAYLAGTVLYVKTMIRERGNPVYRRWSIGYHAGALAAVCWYGPWVTALFAWLLLRSWLLPSRPLRPALVGALEAVNALLLLAVTALTPP